MLLRSEAAAQALAPLLADPALNTPSIARKLC